jgi:transcriptional regulator with PAS, ATPase and Fis domain
MPNNNHGNASGFVHRSLQAVAAWLCGQIDPQLSMQFPLIWDRWYHHYPGWTFPYTTQSGRPLNPASLMKCFDIMADRFAKRPAPGEFHDSVSVWDRESFRQLLSEVGVDSHSIDSVCQRLDQETVLLWQTRESIERHQVPSHIDDPYLRGTAQPFLQARELLYRVAPTNIPVLLCGETGTGKEVFAHALHRISKRNQNPFVAINCGALPETTLESELFGYGPGAFTGALRQGYKGKLGAAHNGTLFLDEVTELPDRVQVTLLRFLETGEIQPLARSTPVSYDVRLVFASQHHPKTLLQSGKLRPDFYYRIAVFPIVIPTLQDRLEDIPVIVDNILKDIAQSRGEMPAKLTKSAVASLADYSWHGNIRELKNLLERASLLAQDTVIDVNHLEKLKFAHTSNQTDGTQWLPRLQAIEPEKLPPLPLPALAAFIARHSADGIRNRHFASTFNVSESTARRHLNALCQAGILSRHGDKKGTKYFCIP